MDAMTASLFFFQAEDGIRDGHVTGVQTCALPISRHRPDDQLPGLASRSAYVVRTMKTPQGAWWEILFGTLPSRNRFAPVIPLLPTTIRSAPFSSATSR